MKKAQVIAIVDRKGGVGKTTTAAFIGCGLVKAKKQVLMIDLDGQHNLSTYAGVNTTTRTVLQVLRQECSVKSAIQSSKLFDIIAANESMDNADTDKAIAGQNKRLAELLRQVEADYDYIILDTPPNMSISVIMALAAADSVVIPAAADMFSLDGIRKTFDMVLMAKKYFKPDIKIMAVILTKIKKTNLNKEFTAIIGDLIKQYGIHTVLVDGIHESISVNECMALHKSPFEYAPKAKPTLDYKKFVEKVILNDK